MPRRPAAVEMHAGRPVQPGDGGAGRHSPVIGLPAGLVQVFALGERQAKSRLRIDVGWHVALALVEVEGMLSRRPTICCLACFDIFIFTMGERLWRGSPVTADRWGPRKRRVGFVSGLYRCVRAIVGVSVIKYCVRAIVGHMGIAKFYALIDCITGSILRKGCTQLFRKAHN